MDFITREEYVMQRNSGFIDLDFVWKIYTMVPHYMEKVGYYQFAEFMQVWINEGNDIWMGNDVRFEINKLTYPDGNFFYY